MFVTRAAGDGMAALAESGEATESERKGALAITAPP